MKYPFCHLSSAFQAKAFLAGTAIFLAMIATGFMLQAQTFTVLHSFTGGQDGAFPASGITLGGSGTLYGTTEGGGVIGQHCLAGCGTVFKLTLHNTNWIFSPLYNFPIAANPRGGITMSPDGIPFGTTTGGDGQSGTVFSVTPQFSICHSVQCFWNKTTVATFNSNFGFNPQYTKLTFDAAGNIYGTTYDGPYPGGGAMYKLTRSGGTWTPTLLQSFGLSDTDGRHPYSNVVIDQQGNYYATMTTGGTAGLGAVVEVIPGEGVYTNHVLYSFANDANGYTPWTGLTIDAQGNLYGTTHYGGSGGGGTVFELSPSGGQWQFKLLYSFTGSGGALSGKLTLDASGNLYGTTLLDGLFDLGMVFKLSPSNGSWILTDLHDFTGGSDGAYPTVDVALDGNGNIYGTASGGGNTGGTCHGGGCGVVWEITP
jgi:uncharacterized repeat protein (TIGR03803 family)